jgi:hypothetical protein
MLFRRILALALVPYVAWLVLAYHYHFLDGVNLAFHEAGHLFFAPFGQFLHILGGTLGQLIVPGLCIAQFLREERPFEAAVCTVWLGESTLYMATYMADAQAQVLPLVGGGMHDWHWLLTRMGLLADCRLLGGLAHALGSGIAVAGLAIALRLAFRPALPAAGGDLAMPAMGPNAQGPQGR